VADEILRMKVLLRKAGKQCGVVATNDDDARRRVDQGFRAIGLGMDAGLLIRSLRVSLSAVGRDRPMRADLALEPEAQARAAPPSLALRAPFRVALTSDFYDSGRLRYRDIGLALFEGTGVDVRPFAEHRLEIGADQLAGVNAVIVLSPRVTAASLAHAADLLAIGRFGVGYDSVDVAACTAADVLLFIAAGAVDRPVAEATIGWMIALSHNMRIKDLLVREGRWDERSRFMGSELRDRTLGVIGFGGIGRELVRLLAGFGMNPPLVYDPFVAPTAVTGAAARPVELDELLTQSDFISIHCPLNDQTRNLISTRELGLMKSSAYLINTARGGIVDESALESALRDGLIAGAAIDCFAGEPLTTPPRVARLDNVLLAPHSIAWTDELFRDIGRAVCRGMNDLANGRVPNGVVNPEVLDRPGFQAKWRRLTVS